MPGVPDSGSFPLDACLARSEIAPKPASYGARKGVRATGAS